MKKALIIIIAFIAFGTVDAFAQKLVYRPVNPNFGGDTFNFQFLLQAATVQNSFTAPAPQNQFNPQSDLDLFTQNLNNLLLNQISNSILPNQFGPNGQLQEGTFNFGSLVVEVFPTADGLVVDILDTATGDQTQITIPNN